jgi:hypothetical protein
MSSHMLSMSIGAQKGAVRRGSSCPCRSGSFGSPAEDDIDGLLAVFGEVLNALDRLEPQPPQHCESGVAQGGQRLWGMSGVGTPFIFRVVNIAHVPETVFDIPVIAGQV